MKSFYNILSKTAFWLIIIFCSSCEQRESHEINIKNHKFDQNIVKIASGKKIKLIVKNHDDEVEEFESLDLKREKIVPPHASINLLIGPLAKGEYKFFGDFHPDTAQGKIIVE